LHLLQHPGLDPKGLTSLILDGQTFCFATSDTNQPPLAIEVPQDNKIEVECDGSIVDIFLTFFGPEGDQLVSLMYTTVGDASDLTVAIDDNKQTASTTINWAPSL
jgi:hypothetical protein